MPADPNLTINSVRSVEQKVSLTFDPECAVSSLAELFRAIALLLAAIGLYGVTAYRWRREPMKSGFAWRLAADALLSAWRPGLEWARLWVVAGRLISSQLYDVSFWEPFALTLAVTALANCSLVAALIPATAAASISPMTALRSE